MTLMPTYRPAAFASFGEIGAALYGPRDPAHYVPRERLGGSPLYLHPAPPSSGLMEEVKALRQIISECAEACGAGIAPTASIEFMAKLPDEIRLSAKLKDATP